MISSEHTLPTIAHQIGGFGRPTIVHRPRGLCAYHAQDTPCIAGQCAKLGKMCSGELCALCLPWRIGQGVGVGGPSKGMKAYGVTLAIPTLDDCTEQLTAKRLPKPRGLSPVFSQPPHTPQQCVDRPERRTLVFVYVRNCDWPKQLKQPMVPEHVQGTRAPNNQDATKRVTKSTRRGHETNPRVTWVTVQAPAIHRTDETCAPISIRQTGKQKILLRCRLQKDCMKEGQRKVAFMEINAHGAAISTNKPQSIGMYQYVLHIPLADRQLTGHP